jgi:hypothetical protein
MFLGEIIHMNDKKETLLGGNSMEIIRLSLQTLGI